jgi:hypothetical protein
MADERPLTSLSISLSGRAAYPPAREAVAHVADFPEHHVALAVNVPRSSGNWEHRMHWFCLTCGKSGGGDEDWSNWRP